MAFRPSRVKPCERSERRPCQTRRLLSLLVLVASLCTGGFSGCFVCGDGELIVVTGTMPLAPGETIQFEFRWEGERVSSPEHCRGYWTVDGIIGGNAELGTVTTCGLYTAPAVNPPGHEPTVCGQTHEPYTCADCCPYACRRVALEAP